LAARDFWADVGEGPRRVRLPGRLAAVSPEKPPVRRPAPLPGEHTAEGTAPGLGDPPTTSPADNSKKRPARPPRPAESDPADNSKRRPARPAVPAAAPAAPTGDELPLDDLKMLDLTWVVAGPAIGRSLADFGATVVRVESSRRIETARHMQPFHGGK